jgi:predicted NAD/FAD-binding protein
MEQQNNRDKGTVAVIGGGVAGIVAAHLLQKTHRVTLFEQGDYLGGHTHTIAIPDGPDAGTPVDTGFIVFNEATYPHFIGFLAELGVPSRVTEMSFGFHCLETGFVYAGNNLNGVFAQRSNILKPQFYRFLLEIGRFCRQGKVDVERSEDLGSLEEYVRRHHFLPFMVDNYLKPMAAAIWSTPTAEVTAFPARAFLLFFRNHGLLDLLNRPAWRTVAGGSNSYVKAFKVSFVGTIHLNTKIRSIFRTDGGVQVQFADQHHEAFDQVVLATHADQALRLLGDPTPDETRLLGPWQYEENQTVLHTDLSVLPPMRRAWSCWNFRREGSSAATQPAYVTYAMNLLQGLTASKQYLVTLNRPSAYDEEQVIARMVYHHPTYTNVSMATQASLPALNGVRNTWFCGSYFGYGFHEDAVRSSYQLAAQLQKLSDQPE